MHDPRFSDPTSCNYCSNDLLGRIFIGNDDQRFKWPRCTLGPPKIDSIVTVDYHATTSDFEKHQRTPVTERPRARMVNDQTAKVVGRERFDAHRAVARIERMTLLEAEALLGDSLQRILWRWISLRMWLKCAVDFRPKIADIIIHAA